SLVRDSDAAAAYNANPAQAIADAHLTDVTSADVNSLIPVVSESFSTGAPGADLGADGNVWASGAATAAFDAFDDVSAPTVDAAHQVVPDAPDQPVVNSAPDGGTEIHTLDADSFGHASQGGDFHIDDAAPAFNEVPDLDHPVLPDHVLPDHDFGDDAPNFDIFT
ncbi:Rv0340 family IniB-related protein, partial [Mycobacterium sp.]|uniref:Rv0340 family IniB-related protein n=1 Tax=Mycobacterium sp. TaxID=1785 RepID=UPI002D5E8449